MTAFFSYIKPAVHVRCPDPFFTTIIMTTLTTRNEIVETNKIIASELAKMQKACYDEVTLKFYREDSEEQVYLEQFDCIQYEELQYETHNKVIGLNHPDLDTFIPVLTDKLTALFQTIHARRFYILSHLKMDFFGNRGNTFKPLVNAYGKLEKMTGKSSYKEAFRIDISELSDFLEIVFWLTRCDPGVPEFIFLFDEDEKIQINLCQYGNIHLTEFENEQLTKEIVSSLGWTIIEEQESDSFTTSEQ